MRLNQTGSLHLEMMLRNMLEKESEDQIIGGASKRSYWMLFQETGSYVVGLEVVAVFLPPPTTCKDPGICPVLHD